LSAATLAVVLAGLAACASTTSGPGPAAVTASLPTTPSPTPPAPPPPFHPMLPRGARVAFFGDSQGTTLLATRPADLGSWIEAIDATISGCGILLGDIVTRSREGWSLGDSCPNWLYEWTTRADQLDPALAVIVLGAWDVFDLRRSDGSVLTFGTAAWDLNFEAALDQGIAALRGDGGRPVALALLPCYRPQERRTNRPPGYWPERGDDDRTRHVNALLEAAAAEHPIGVFTLQPPQRFCTDLAADTDYRYDGLHFLPKGSALYFEAILPQILAEPPAPAPTTTAPSSAT
jgi:hypothetical protein